MTMPPFVKLEHDTATRKAIVSVKDKEVRNQREMWGMHPFTSISWFHQTKDSQVLLGHIYKTIF